MMKKVLYVAFILTAFTLAACSTGTRAVTTETPESVPADYAGKNDPLGADAAGAGAVIFKANCESCHGAQGRGDGPASAALDPKPRNLPIFAPTVGDDYLFWRISTGRDGTAMVAWKGTLTDEQIWQVITFIRTLKP